jgi:hypothetical protein
MVDYASLGVYEIRQAMSGSGYDVRFGFRNGTETVCRVSSFLITSPMLISLHRPPTSPTTPSSAPTRSTSPSTPLSTPSSPTSLPTTPSGAVRPPHFPLSLYPSHLIARIDTCGNNGTVEVCSEIFLAQDYETLAAKYKKISDSHFTSVGSGFIGAAVTIVVMVAALAGSSPSIAAFPATC